MKNYIVIVRDYDPWHGQPPDAYLKALDMYYQSPVVSLDMENDWEDSLNNFLAEYGRYFPNFRNINLELIEV